MGLFSRKSPEEKRIKKFNQTEKYIVNSMKNYKVNNFGCNFQALLKYSTTEEDYRKVADHFKEWAINCVPETLAKSKKFNHINFWNVFSGNYIFGPLSLMTLGEYGECLKCLDALIDAKEDLYSTKIARGSGSFITIAEHALASTGAGGSKKQERLIQQVEFYKIICLTETGKEPNARVMLDKFPDGYAIEVETNDDYYNEHFKYKDNLSVEYMKKILNE